MKIRNFLFLITFLGLLGFSWPFSWLFSQPNPEPFGSSSWLNRQINILQSTSNGLDPNVLRLSLIAYMTAQRQGISHKQYLTVIDYSKPSNEKRMWVFDLKTGRTLFHTLVSHGKNSGGPIANSFSNANGSLKSSFGLFVTDSKPYMGGNGYSLRMRGLEHGVNDNAYNRNVVVHGAWYVNPSVVRQYGQLGRSWGCPAVSTELAKPIIDTIKDNTLIFVYYPDQNWLKHSRYLASA